MKANELRIGNLVKNQYDEKSITIKGYDINDLCDGMDSEVFQPIKLTEEWLLRFGFDKITNKDKGFTQSTYVNKTGFKLYLNFDDGKITLDFINGSQWIYVHQLQNLYFALTGQELAIVK